MENIFFVKVKNTKGNIEKQKHKQNHGNRENQLTL